MGQASAVNLASNCERCDYTPRWGDTFYIVDYEVTHIICYQCGNEWVE